MGWSAVTSIDRNMSRRVRAALRYYGMAHNVVVSRGNGCVDFHLKHPDMPASTLVMGGKEAHVSNDIIFMNLVNWAREIEHEVSR
jgi:hypothetical protein